MSLSINNLINEQIAQSGVTLSDQERVILEQSLDCVTKDGYLDADEVAQLFAKKMDCRELATGLRTWATTQAYLEIGQRLSEQGSHIAGVSMPDQMDPTCNVDPFEVATQGITREAQFAGLQYVIECDAIYGDADQLILRSCGEYAKAQSLPLANNDEARYRRIMEHAIEYQHRHR